MSRDDDDPRRTASRLLADMSHELRTPLNAIIGFADLLGSGTVSPESPKHHQFLRHIAASGRELLQMINDILDLAKIETGRLEFRPERVKMAELLRDLASTVSGSVGREAVSLEIDSDTPGLMLDPERLKQALHEYIVTAAGSATKTGQVRIRVQSSGSSGLCLRIGAPESSPEVEESRDRGGRPRSQPRRNLTLELCRRLIEAQGGVVDIGEPGSGYGLRVVLDSVPNEESTDGETSSGRPAELQTARLLVIQDPSHDQPSLTHGFAEAGFDVDSVGTGAQAVMQAAHNVYDAIALDLLLPDQSGLSALEVIRSKGPSRLSPVVSVSIAADCSKVATFAVADVLSKPINAAEIAQAMQRFQAGLGRPARVMVVDDDPMAVDLMREVLGRLGVECIGIGDGRQAVQEIEGIRPDALILDLLMPEFDGFAVLDSLRRSEVGRSTPVFIWTNMTITIEEYENLKQSAHAIVSKGGGAVETMLEDLRRRSSG